MLRAVSAAPLAGDVRMRQDSRAEADHAAAAEWAETTITDLTRQSMNSGDASREACRWAMTVCRR